MASLEKHALEMLDHKYLWKTHLTQRIQASGEPGGKFSAVTPTLLYYLIKESQKFGGQVLEQFWYELGTCHEKLRENIEHLKMEDFVSAQRSFEVLFWELLDPRDVNLRPLQAMAAEFFIHLGVALIHPGEPKSGISTDYSVTDAISDNVDNLLEIVDEEEHFGTRKEVALKALCFKRDGQYCPLTHWQFKPYKRDGVKPALAHIIPNSVHGKPQTLKCIAMFAGEAAAKDVAEHLNGPGNVMNIQRDVRDSYDDLDWGIEVEEEGGKVKYIFRTISSPTSSGSCVPDHITLEDGDEIQFGKGPHGERLGNGPIPRLCNLQLAVARVMKMSAAADIILEWKDNADDDGCSRLFVASEAYCDMLDAKLLLSGRAEIV